MDINTFLGIGFALFCILLGNHLEGGHASSLVQVTAFLIVIGGTIGAVIVSLPSADLHALKLGVRSAFKNKKHDPEETIQKLVEFAGIARRDGVLALEQRLGEIEDPFMKQGLSYLVDGVDLSVARDAMETEIHTEFEETNAGGKIFEAAGAFAPTIGVLGAVLGLIHVMSNLSNPDAIGPGIAVAFVATVYGVGFANIVFLPMGAKIKRKAAIERDRKTLIAEGLLSIQEGLNPRVLENKLRAYAGLPPSEGKEG